MTQARKTTYARPNCLALVFGSHKKLSKLLRNKFHLTKMLTKKKKIKMAPPKVCGQWAFPPLRLAVAVGR